MERLTASQALINLILSTRRQGNTQVLLESPKVVSGEALFVAWDKDHLDLCKSLCPKLRGTTLQQLISGVGDTKGPVVFDLSTVYVALAETSKNPYEIVESGQSREVQEIRSPDGKIERIEPVHGSEKAWVRIRLMDGTIIKVNVPYTVPSERWESVLYSSPTTKT